MQSRKVTPKAQTEPTLVRFRDLSGSGKALFVCKVVVCIVTGGFVFPNVMERNK